MSKIALQLSVNQYLTSFGIKIEPNKSTFLVAPTGAGKTTFTMEELKAQFKFVLILVPTQAKVMELQHEYSGKTKVISEYLFFVQTRTLTIVCVSSKVSLLRPMTNSTKSFN